jgi:hypothetical protein
VTNQALDRPEIGYQCINTPLDFALVGTGLNEEPPAPHRHFARTMSPLPPHAHRFQPAGLPGIEGGFRLGDRMSKAATTAIIRSVIALKGGVRWACPRHAADGGDYWVCGHCKYGCLVPYDEECFNCHAEIRWETARAAD